MFNVYRGDSRQPGLMPRTEPVTGHRGLTDQGLCLGGVLG